MTAEAPSPDFDALARTLARDLLRIGAVALSPEEPFTWASGLLSPIYCDNRLTLGYPEVRRRIARGFAERFRALQALPDAIVGIATAGIPHACWAAEALDLPMAYVRPKPKEHGRGNQIEGRLLPGQRVAVVEDLISTGGSSLSAVRALRQVGLDVAVVGSVFTYGLAVAESQFRNAGVDCFSLTSFKTLLDVAVEEGRLPEKGLRTLRAWQRDPLAWQP